MSHESMTLGICDWGIGGLALYDLLKKARPDINIAYICDQGSTPYSLLSRQDLTDRVRQIELVYRQLGISRVVFASNAASTSLEEVSVEDMEATGVVEPTLRAMRGRKYREVGIIGGRRTILSGAFGRSLRKQRFCVLQRMSLDLSILIENGWGNDDRTREMLEVLLEPLIKVDGLMIASAPYRIVTRTIQDILPRADIIDPLVCTAEELAQTLPETDSAPGADVFYTTGEPEAMQKRAHEAFGLSLRVDPISVVGQGLAAQIFWR